MTPSSPSPSPWRLPRRFAGGPLPFAWSAWRRLAAVLVVVALLWLAVGWANGWFVVLAAGAVPA